MPEASELGSFSMGADTGAKKATAALLIQEAYRLHLQRKLCKVCCSSGLTFTVRLCSSAAHMQGE